MIKFPSQAAFLEKCACLLSAILKDTGFVPTTIYGGRLSVTDFQNDFSGTISDKRLCDCSQSTIIILPWNRIFTKTILYAI